MTTHLFVYGSLMPHTGGTFARAERTRLANDSTIAGPASLMGRLFDLGDYPGLVIPPNGAGAAAVHGVLLRLKDPDATFGWLDPFEDIEPGRDPEMNAYARILGSVTTDGGDEIATWVYVMRRVPAGAREISSGRWHTSSF